MKNGGRSGTGYNVRLFIKKRCSCSTAAALILGQNPNERRPGQDEKSPKNRTMNKEAENDRRRARKPDDGVDGFFFIFMYEHIVICSSM